MSFTERSRASPQNNSSYRRSKAIVLIYKSWLYFQHASLWKLSTVDSPDINDFKSLQRATLQGHPGLDWPDSVKDGRAMVAELAIMWMNVLQCIWLFGFL